MKTLIVIPAFNEQDTIKYVINEVAIQLPNADILVVNDGSTDQTESIVEELDVELISMPFNLGVGAAVRAGFKYAERNGYELLVQFDGDGQHIASEITKLIDCMNKTGADTVVGNRFHEQSSYEITAMRKSAIRFLALLVLLVSRKAISDPTSGFRANNRSSIMYYSKSYPTDYLGDTVESIVVGIRNGIKITNVDIHMNERQGGEPSQNLVKSFLYLLRTTLVILASATRSKK